MMMKTVDKRFRDPMMVVLGLFLTVLIFLVNSTSILGQDEVEETGHIAEVLKIVEKGKSVGESREFKVWKVSQKEWVNGAVGMELLREDGIKTTAKVEVIIQFIDGKEATIHKNSYISFGSLIIPLTGYVAIITGITQGETQVTESVDLEVWRASEGEWVTGLVGMELAENDEIKTGKTSKAMIEFSDGDVVAINGDSHIKIEPLSEGEAKSIFAKAGEIWAKAKGKFIVRTEKTVASVLGTEFNLKLTESGDVELVVIEGAVEFSNDLGEVVATKLTRTVATTDEGPEPRGEVEDEEAAAGWVKEIEPLEVASPSLPPPEEEGEAQEEEVVEGETGEGEPGPSPELEEGVETVEGEGVLAEDEVGLGELENVTQEVEEITEQVDTIIEETEEFIEEEEGLKRRGNLKVDAQF